MFMSHENIFFKQKKNSLKTINKRRRSLSITHKTQQNHIFVIFGLMFGCFMYYNKSIPWRDDVGFCTSGLDNGFLQNKEKIIITQAPKGQ